MKNDRRQDAIAGLLLGTAVGDAIGLPYEGMSPQRIARLRAAQPLRHRLVFGRGMISDDTEHACMTAQALLACGGDEQAFTRSLAWRLRGWLLGIPAGVGLATLKSILRLWACVPASRSGVRSAGNGAAMRAGIIGAAVQDVAFMERLVAASTNVTHRDPRALQGSLIIAHCARLAATSPAGAIDAQAILPLTSLAQDPDLRERFFRALDAAALEAGPTEFGRSLDLHRGVTGFINDTLPAVIYCWLRYRGDVRATIDAAVTLGGDTDTVAAIAGGLAGASTGVQSIPDDWLNGLVEWPRNAAFMRDLADRLAAESNAEPVRRCVFPGILLRNAAFAGIVITHGFRRLLPPY